MGRRKTIWGKYLTPYELLLRFFKKDGKMNIRKISIAALVALSVGLTGLLPAEASLAQNAPRATAPAAIPDALKKSAIATRSDKSGQIAGAQIGNNEYYVVYIKTQRGCGSGGCRAQIWKREGRAFVQKQSLNVGSLPIVMIPQKTGMPQIGVTTYDGGKPEIISHSFNGSEYTINRSARLPANTGRTLIATKMLKNF